jgi:hypothetical protein
VTNAPPAIRQVFFAIKATLIAEIAAGFKPVFRTIFNFKIEARIRGRTQNRVKSVEANGAGGGNRTERPN